MGVQHTITVENAGVPLGSGEQYLTATHPDFGRVDVYYDGRNSLSASGPYTAEDTPGQTFSAERSVMSPANVPTASRKLARRVFALAAAASEEE